VWFRCPQFSFLRSSNVCQEDSARLEFFVLESEPTMLHRRFHIRAGALTTAGGIARASSSFMTFNGAPLVLEGDKVDCPACGSVGIIHVVMPRLHDAFNGRQYALGDDLCICKCNPPPKLISEQTFKCQTFVLASLESAEEAAQRATSKNAGVEELMPIRLVDEITGQPYVGRPYKLDLTGTVLEGVTDADGLTKPLSKAERDALIAWSVAPAA
jgi:uncharacterized Zn-binding protein involved in type VI secretion